MIEIQNEAQVQLAKDALCGRKTVPQVALELEQNSVFKDRICL
jgi:hypothetical protein